MERLNDGFEPVAAARAIFEVLAEFDQAKDMSFLLDQTGTLLGEKASVMRG
ncbi:hypothetical protein [Halocatena halophila]|uniref:hypothetical protein n=1 Tax=Halocatena halophila TaxID=2814576 RepID=UPI002ED0CD55